MGSAFFFNLIIIDWLLAISHFQKTKTASLIPERAACNLSKNYTFLITHATAPAHKAEVKEKARIVKIGVHFFIIFLSISKEWCRIQHEN
ncbi:MAG: hypothetical protein J6R18_04615 [Kiritimatiellae bacterium]|nr:hypothetical protein [Kiritimatiellia bacterium]